MHNAHLAWPVTHTRNVAQQAFLIGMGGVDAYGIDFGAILVALMVEIYVPTCSPYIWMARPGVPCA